MLKVAAIIGVLAAVLYVGYLLYFSDAGWAGVAILAGLCFFTLYFVYRPVASIFRNSWRHDRQDAVYGLIFLSVGLVLVFFFYLLVEVGVAPLWGRY